MKTKILFNFILLVCWFDSREALAQRFNLITWKLVDQQVVFVSRTIITEESIFNKINSSELEVGIYIAYFGEDNIEKFNFPEDLVNTIYSLYEDPLLNMMGVGDTCYREADPLPNGKWLKIRVNRLGEVDILKEKNVKDGYLDGKVEFNRTKDDEALDSRTILVYKQGYLTYREVFDKQGRILMKGIYLECNKIEEEKIWDDGYIWKIYSNGVVTEYNKQGKVIQVIKTDSWGRY